MILKKCLQQDKTNLLSFYRNVCDNTKNMSVYGRWIYGIYPTDNILTDYIDNGQMYCLQNGNDIIGAVALTDQNSSYHGINWSINLPVEDVLVVHVLAVHPYFQQQGTARKIMQDVIAYAENTRKKAIRLDALAGNLPAHHLYESLGFIKCDTRNRYAENTGFTDFYLFEMIL